MISRKNRKALFFSSLGVFVAASSVLTTSCATSSLKEEKREQEEYVKYNVSISTDYKGFVVVDGKKAPSYNKKIAIGRDISFSVEPYDGYVFDHWSDGSTDISRSITVYDNINIVAIFKERPFTSTPIKNYKLNVNSTAGGNIYLGGKRIDIPYNQEYQSSTKVKLAAKPSDNYAFTGWSDGVNDSIRTVTINDEVTLFATFTRAPLKPCEFNIYRSVNGKVQIDGVDINVPYQQTYLENTTIEVKAIAESDEYIFNGWDDGVEENPRTITFEKDDITFSPIFSPIGGQPFTIQLRKPDNGKYRIANNLITSSYEQTFNSGSEVLVEAIADANYKFERWSDNLTVNPRPINKGVEDLYPIFVPIKFTVDLKKPTNGHYEINDQTINDGFNQTYDVGQSIEVKAVANKDFVFDHWSDNTTANPKTISSNTEGLYPIFVACDFTIKLAKPEHGYYLVNKEPIHYEYSATFKNGKSVTIEAIPLKDYKLRSWNDNSTDAIKTITQSAELSATFIPKRIILKVQKPEEGTCTINGTAIKETFDQEVQYEQKFEIVVTADVGYKFDHWNNSPSDTNPVKQITITESMSLVPYFTTLDAYKLSIATSEGGRVHFMSDGKSILLEGDNVFTRDDLQWNDSITVQVLPNEGYKFVGWEGGEPRQLSSQGNYTINVRKDTYVKAIFAQAKYDLSVKANDGGQVKVTIGDNQQSFIVDKDNSLDLKELVHGTKILIEAIPDVKRNYKLNNWNDDKTDNSLTKEFELTKDTSLVANFDEISKQTHSFVASVSDGGEIRINNLGKKYTRYTTTIEEGNEVQIEAIAKDGYVFDRWSDDATIKDLSRTITVKNDMQISAYFTKKVYKIYLYTVGNGQIKLLENTLKAIEQVKEPFKIHVFSAHYNDVITIEALPDVAYFYFKGWSDCEGADSVRRTITVTDDLWLGAQFGYTDKNVLTIPETKNVTYKVDGVEINTPYYKQLNDGEKVKIEAIVEDNYKIKCWSDNAITSSERDIAFYKDLTIFPILEEKEKKYEHIDWWKNTTPINSKFFTTVCDRVDPNSKFVTDDNDFYCNFGKGKYTDPLSGSQYDVMRIEGCGKYTDIGSTEQNPDTAALNFTTCQQLIDRIFDGLEGGVVEPAYFTEENRQERLGFVWAKNSKNNWQPYVVKEIADNCFKRADDWYLLLSNPIHCSVIIPWTVDYVGENSFHDASLNNGIYNGTKLHAVYANRYGLDKNGNPFYEGVIEDKMDWTVDRDWDKKADITYDYVKNEWIYSFITRKYPNKGGEIAMSKLIPIAKKM